MQSKGTSKDCGYLALRGIYGSGRGVGRLLIRGSW